MIAFQQPSFSALHNNSTRQSTSGKAAAKVVPIGKSARQSDLILLNPGVCEISNGYTANPQQRISLMQSQKGVCPLPVSIASRATQSLHLPGEKDIISQYPLNSGKVSNPTPYKSALLSFEPVPPRPKSLILTFPLKPKNLERRCFRCLSYSHFVANCRDPVICWFCRASGHTKKSCSLRLKNKAQSIFAKAASMEPIVLGRPTSLDVQCPPARDLNLISSSQTHSQTRSIPVSSRAPNAHHISSSQNSRTDSRAAASLFRMGDRARRSFQQNANPNLYDLLAFLAQTRKVEFISSPGHAPHASVVFEKGAFHIRLELSPCRILEAKILVSQVDSLDEPTFPCFNINSGFISRESYRSLLFSMLPGSEEGPVMALLPAVYCRYKVKPVIHTKLIAAEVTPLSLAPLSQRPAMLPSDSLQASFQSQQPLFLPSPPVCTMPTPVQPVVTSFPPPVRSPVAVMPLEMTLCARRKRPAEPLLHQSQDCSHPTSEHSSALASSRTQNLLQLLPAAKNGKVGIPDLNATPVYILDNKNTDTMQVYVRRSPRIQKAYDGVHINSVERASRRVAAATPVSSGGSASSSGSRRRGRPKTRKIDTVAPLPITTKPRPTTKSKIKELAELCGLKAADTFREAALKDRMDPSVAGSSTYV